MTQPVSPGTQSYHRTINGLCILTAVMHENFLTLKSGILTAMVTLMNMMMIMTDDDYDDY